MQTLIIYYRILYDIISKTGWLLHVKPGALDLDLSWSFFDGTNHVDLSDKQVGYDNSYTCKGRNGSSVIFILNP